MTYFSPYGWANESLMIKANLDKDGPASDPICAKIRETEYEIIREKSGLPFEGYGDEPERWLQWMAQNGPPVGEEPHAYEYTVIAWDGKSRYLFQCHKPIRIPKKKRKSSANPPVVPLQTESLPDPESDSKSRRGRIYNTEIQDLSIPLNIDTIFAQGEWYPIEVSEEQVKEWLQQYDDAIARWWEERDRAYSLNKTIVNTIVPPNPE